MAIDIGTSVNFDVGPALTALDKLGLAGTSLRDEQLRSNAAVSQSFSTVAQSAVAYSNELAKQQAEVRNASAATKSALEEVRRLTNANKDLAAAQKATTNADEVKRLGVELAKNTAKIKEAKQAITDNKTATDQERQAVLAIAEARRQEVNQTKLAAAAARDAATATKQEAQAAKEAAASAKQVGQATEGAGKSGGLFFSVLGKAGALLGGLFVAEKIKEVGTEIIQVTSEFQKYETVLTNAFQGDNARAKNALLQIQQFADANGLDIARLTDTYASLVNRGIVPTQQQLRQLSDIAATSGKSTEQYVEALLDAQTGEFERLKEFGIKVKNNGDTLVLSFRGVKTEVKNTQEAISAYLFALGDLNGVQGTAAALAEQTGGRIATLKNSFTELFVTIGQGTSGPINNFVKGLTLITKGVAEFLKSDKQKITEAAAGPAQIYADSLDQQFKAAAERAKKNSKSVYYAVYDVARVQDAELKRQLDEATANINALNAIDKGYRNSADRAALVTRVTGKPIEDPDNLPALRAAEKEALLGQRTYLEYVKASQLALKERAKIAITGNKTEAEQLGLVAAQQKKIADLQARQKTAALEKQAGGGDYLLGVDGLDEQLDKAEKELSRLLGRVEKGAKTATDRLTAALKALYAERETLRSLAAKASVKVSEDESERAQLGYEEQLKQIDNIAQKLREKEAAVKKAGGRGVNADGKLDTVQEKQLGILRAAAQEQLTKELARIEREREALLLSLREDSDQTELARLEAAFNEQIRLNERQAGVRLALETKYEREREALLKTQATRQAQQEQQLGSNQADATAEVFGSDTGQSVYDAQFSARQQQLDADKTFAEKRLEILRDSKDKEAETERAALAAQLLRIRNQQQQLNQEVAQSRFSIYSLVLGENDSNENRQKVDEIVSQSVQAINTVLQAQEQAAQARIDLANQNLSDLRSNLESQITLNASGNASSIALVQAAISEEKAARSAAIADKKRAQKEEALINSAQQGSALLTAAANLILGWSELPLVGQVLGALSVAAMLASFLAAQSAVSSATSGSYFKGGYTGQEGGYTGDGNPRDVSTAQGRRSYEYHKREFIMRHEITDVFRRSLLEPLHQNRPQDINWWAPEMQGLRPPQPLLLPNLNLPENLRVERKIAIEHSLKISSEPLQAEIRDLRAELVQIKGHVERTADKKNYLALGEKQVMEIDSKGNTHIKDV